MPPPVNTSPRRLSGFAPSLPIGVYLKLNGRQAAGDAAEVGQGSRDGEEPAQRRWQIIAENSCLDRTKDE